MKKNNRFALPVFLASVAFSAQVQAVCVPNLPIAAVNDISVSYWTGATDSTHRQEFVHISEALADALGIDGGDVDTSEEGEAPNPQIRVRIQNVPAAIDEIVENNAVFTVTEIIETGDSSKRIWVHEQVLPDVEESGQFKLFARTDQTIAATPDSDHDHILDDILVTAYTIPVSSSVLTTNGSYWPVTTYFCEPDTAMSYTEKAYRRLDDDRVAVLAPHGGNIEKGTSAQAYRFASSLYTFNGTKVNIWDLVGRWGHDQTDERWHITSTSIDIASYPGLNAFRPSDDPRQFDRAVSFHGYGGPDAPEACGAGQSLKYEIILGGGGERNLKCAIAYSIQWATSDAIAIDLRDDGGHIPLPDACGRFVTTGGRAGLHDDNIVNRIATFKGIQIEQSEVVREDATYIHLVPDAVAWGFALYAAYPGTNYCNLL